MYPSQLERHTLPGLSKKTISRVQAAVDGAVKVPIYIPETRWSPMNVLKQLSNFGLGGWWLGGSHMIPNQTFMQDVRSQVPQDSKVIVACQKGLR